MAETMKVRQSRVSLWHLLAGVIMALMGIYVWFNPAVTLMALALYLGIVFIVVGVGYFSASFTYESGWYMLVGALDVFVGVIFVANLGVSAASMPIIFALWCLAVGIIQLVTAFQYRSAGQPVFWPMVAGIIGILFAFLILTYPAVGTITLTALMGAYFVLYGAVEIAEYLFNRKLFVAYDGTPQA